MADDLQKMAEPRLGGVLRGKYRLDRVRGIGAMATVYSATQRNRKRVAIKMLHPELPVGAHRSRSRRRPSPLKQDSVITAASQGLGAHVANSGKKLTVQYSVVPSRGLPSLFVVVRDAHTEQIF